MLPKPSEPCSCEVCVGYCQRPGWPTPEEAAQIIEAGNGHLLMLDYWVASPILNRDIDVLCPAVEGCAGTDAPFYPIGTCVCLSRSGKCIIHDIKPIECAAARHDIPLHSTVHMEIAKLWRSKYAKNLVSEWKKNYYIPDMME